MAREQRGTGWFREKYARQETTTVPAGTVAPPGNNVIGNVLDLQGAVGLLASIEVATLSATSIEVIAELSIDQVNWYRLSPPDKLESAGTVTRTYGTYQGRYLRFRTIVAGGAPIATPVIASAAAEGAGSALLAGNYRYVLTALDAAGETIASNEVTAAVTAGQKVKVKWAEVVGATGGYRLYRSPLNGAAASENAYQAIAGAATVEFVDNGVAGTAGKPPPVGTSGGDAILGITAQTVRDRKPGGVNNV